ncbi:MAG: ABC transporter permease [Candidatus Margulisbacteria bacterium]|nr:ABC transporter permease [Candidatus Margulisiibacteriota bacterium]
MIELKGINKIYRTGKIEFQALHNVDLKIESGEFVAIMGPSGSGKSTLLHILGLLDIPDSGAYKLFEQDVSILTEMKLSHLRNRVAGFVFQQFFLLPGVQATDNVALPQVYSGKKIDRELANEKLSAVGLQERTHHVPNELSGGERQRVAIARALINNPLILFADEPTGNLDTKSEAEIMKILSGLHQKGMTIVMVTHEREIADYAERIITMRDGKIIGDEHRKESKLVDNPEHKKVIREIVQDQNGIINNIEFLTFVKEAWHSLLINKMRSILSMLGILIGVAAVIAMLALGTGATRSIEQDLSSLGSNVLNIHPGGRQWGGVSMGAGAVSRFTLRDLQVLNNVPGVKYVSGQISGRGQVLYGGKNWSTQIYGVNPSYAQMRKLIPEAGRFFIDNEMKKREKLAVIGLTIVKELFGTENPIGKTIKINKINFKVIGVQPDKGFSRGRDQNDTVLVPLTTAMYRLFGEDYINNLEVEIADKKLIDAATEQIRTLLYRLHNYPLANKELIDIHDMSEIQEAIRSTIRTISILLGTVAAIALLVGGIGIMNIMLVSVTERTREIGLRKAVGANRKDIMSQFLVEAIVMTVSGGLLGILFGWGITKILSLFTGWATIVSLLAVILSTSFSIVVGLVFGLWPAKKAANLNTIDALRYE